MKQDNDILTQIGRRSGMTVPDGYFADFASKMMERLPDQAPAKPEAKTMWVRLRPYVYMAAMFAGIWCMLNIFNVIGSRSTDLSIDSNPIVAKALSNDQFVDEFYLNDVDEDDLLEDMFDMGLSPDEIGDSIGADSL